MLRFSVRGQDRVLARRFTVEFFSSSQKNRQFREALPRG